MRPASDMSALDVERGRARGSASLLHDAEREGEGDEYVPEY